MKQYMKINSAILTAVFAAAVAHGAPNDKDAASTPLQVYPKNLARQHLGANLLAFNAANQTYAPTEAAAAWLDDDVATGWPALSGRHYYLVALPEPQLLSSFAISARSTAGTVSLYAGDEPAPPSAKSWVALAKDVSVDSINEKLANKSFSRFAKYLLVETNLTEAGPWYSIYLYGEKPAVAYHVERRAQPVDPGHLFGPYSNPQTAFSMSSLYAHSHVAFANTAETTTEWQKAIDDNPETGTNIAPSKKAAGLVIDYDSLQSIQRISVLTDGRAKGNLEFFLKDATKTANASTKDSQYIQVSNPIGAAPSDNSAVDGMKPVATIHFDGTNARGSADFAPVNGSQLIARWTPDDASQLIAVREVNSFGADALNDHQLVANDPSGEDLQVDASKDPGSFKDGKEPLPPVAEAFALKTPFVPGPPPPPPNVPFSNR